MKTIRYRGYPSGDAVAGAVVETLTPARAPDLRADFITPAAQSLFSGLVGGLACAVGAWRVWNGDVLTWACGGFVVALGASWVISLGLVRDLLWTIERVAARDLDGDGAQGKPDDSHALLVNPDRAREKAQRATHHREHAVKLADFLTFWRQCATVGTAERSHGIKPGTPQQAAYRAKRDALVRLGLARWQDDGNHNRGWELTTDEATALDLLRQHVRDLT